MSSWVTFAEVKAFTSGVPDRDDALLSTIATSATDIVRTAIRNHVRDPLFDLYRADEAAPLATTRLVHGDYSIWLRPPPYESGTLTTITDSTSTLVNAATYAEITSGPMRGAIKLLADPWTEDAMVGWVGTYTVTASWTYGVVPEALKELVKEICVDIYRSKDTGFGDRFGASDGGAVEIIGRMDSLQRNIISNYVEMYRRASRYE